MARKKKDDAPAGSEGAAPEATTTFEEDLARLEAIVSQLEDGDLPLERALALFEEGTALGRRCGLRLDEVERKLTVLVERADGKLEERDLAAGGAAAAPPAPKGGSPARRAPSEPPARGGRLFDDDEDDDGPDEVPF